LHVSQHIALSSTACFFSPGVFLSLNLSTSKKLNFLYGLKCPYPHTLKMGKTNQTHTSTASAYTDLLSVRCQICKKGNLFLPACGDISICQISHWFTFSAFNNSQSPQSLKISMEVFMNHAVTCYLGDSAVGRVFRIRFCAVSGKKWSRCTA